MVNIEKMNMKCLKMHIANLKLRFYIYKVSSWNIIFSLYSNVFGIKEKSIVLILTMHFWPFPKIYPCHIGFMVTFGKMMWYFAIAACCLSLVVTSASITCAVGFQRERRHTLQSIYSVCASHHRPLQTLSALKLSKDVAPFHLCCSNAGHFKWAYRSFTMQSDFH